MTFDLRPDHAQWGRISPGTASPLWLPFLMAASAGAAWWTYANWTRLAATSWAEAVQRQATPVSELAPATAQAADETSQSPEAVQDALIESTSVQGVAPSEEPAAAPPPEKAPADAAEPAEDGMDAIDAAYAENLGPVPPPASGKKKAGKKKG